MSESRGSRRLLRGLPPSGLLFSSLLLSGLLVPGMCAIAEEVAVQPLAATTDTAALLAPPPIDAPKNLNARNRTAPAALAIDEAVLIALERNRDLRIKRLSPAKAAAGVAGAEAAWDPTLDVQASLGRGSNSDGTSTNTTSGTVGLSDTLPTGTSISAQATGSRTAQVDPNPTAFLTDPSSSAGVSLTITQALLNGGSLEANRAVLNQARIDLTISRYEVRAVASTLVADVETAYWNMVLAQEQVAIVTASKHLAEEDLARVEIRIKNGALRASERPASAATLADRQASLIEAEAQLDTARLNLWSLLDLALTAPAPRTITRPDAAFTTGETVLAVDEHVRVALALRPDLHQAELQRQRGDLDVVTTRNGLLPKLDLFVRLGRTGYSDSFNDAARGDGLVRDATVGLHFQQILGNRAAEANHDQAVLSLDELDQALANQKQLAELDVRKAHREVVRADAQVVATRARVEARAEALRQQRASFDLNRATTYDVSLAEQDLVQAQLDQAQAQVTARTARTALHQSDGSLLQRRGITAPGLDPASSSPSSMSH